MHPRKFSSLILSAGLILAVLAACTPPSSPEKKAVQAMYNTMTPHYAAWRDSSAALSTASKNFCSGTKSLADTRQQWKQTVMAWSAIQAFPVGPVTDKGYDARVTYWPDPKNLVAFQVEKRLKENTQTALSESSVALRGLSAAEYILFDQAIDMNQPDVRQHYCPLLQEIGVYQMEFSSRIELEWQASGKNIQAFPNERFASENDALTEYLRTQVNAIDSLGKRLEEPLKSGRAQVYQLEYWRSRQSLATMDISAKMAETLWQQGWRPLAEKKDKALANRVDQAYLSLGGNLPGNALVPLSTLITTAEGVAWVRNRQAELRTLDTLQGRELAKLLGIQIGFNANDGD